MELSQTEQEYIRQALAAGVSKGTMQTVLMISRFTKTSPTIVQGFVKDIEYATQETWRNMESIYTETETIREKEVRMAKECTNDASTAE